MKPDLTNENGIAALFVASNGPKEHGENYIMDTSGVGWRVANIAGGPSGRAWTTFEALPSGVDIESVMYWTPWTICTQAGDWYFRSNPSAAWETAALGIETAPVAVVPRSPKVQITIT
jgi:hypothetical protein